MNPGPKLLTGGMIAAVGIVIATWWIIGPLEEAGSDYMLRPPNILPAAEQAAGVISLIAVGIVSLWALIQHRLRQIRTGWWIIAYLIALASFGTGAASRLVTARTSGANIGGGMAILFGGPLIIGLLIGATVWATVLLYRDPQPYDPALSPREATALSTAALVVSTLGLLGFILIVPPIIASITATVFGWPALRRIRHDPKIPGRGTAICALAIAMVNLVIFVLLLAL